MLDASTANSELREWPQAIAHAVIPNSEFRISPASITLTVMPARTLLTRLTPFVRLSHDFPTPAFSLPPRRINDHALLYFKLGGGTFVHGETEFEIQPGSLFLVRPTIEHRFDGRGAPFHMLNMHVDMVERPDSASIDIHQRPGTCGLRGPMKSWWRPAETGIRS